MPYCSACGSEIEENERFCASCGEDRQSGSVPVVNRRAPTLKPKLIYGLIGLMVIVLIIGLSIGWEDEIDIYGIWVDIADPENFLEIRRDRTFCIFSRRRREGSGIWRIVGNEISFEVMGEVLAGRIEGNALILRCPRDIETVIFVRP